MAAYVTGQKGNNNQQGVFPDNTPDAFDNPRIEYIGELLRRVRGRDFGVGIVTTSDVDGFDTGRQCRAYRRPLCRRRDRGAVLRRTSRENGVRVLLGGGVAPLPAKVARRRPAGRPYT